MKQDTQRWIAKAEEDLAKAHGNCGIKYYDIAIFLCQQAVEKGLKAIIIERDDELVKTHDLVRLGKLAKIPDDLLEPCKRMADSYMETRYPDVFERDVTESDATMDLKDAGRILQWVKNILSKS